MRFTAKRLPVQPGPAGWNAILPPRPPSPPLRGDETADVAIIGAGFAGLSAAHRLMQLDPTLRVVLLEAGTVGDGPAGRNSGFMIDLPHDLASDGYAGADCDSDRSVIARNRIAINFARALARETAMPQDVFDPCGKINAAASEAGDTHNRQFAAHLAALGEPGTLLDRQQMADLTGTGFYRSGLHTPGAVMIQPAAYVRTLAEELATNVRLCETSPVTAIERRGDSWTVETQGGKVSTPRIILATNGHAESFGFHRRRLMHVFTYASMTRSLTPAEARTLGGSPRWGVTPADPMGTTVRRIDGPGGSRILIRARFTYDPGMEVSNGRVKRTGRMHDTRFRDRFPMLGDVEMEYRWAGHLCLSWNGVPAFGEIEPGLFSAVCQNGLGTVQGTLAGLAAAECALEQMSTAAESLLAHDRPHSLPPEPLAWIGANSLMRWREWRAGAE